MTPGEAQGLAGAAMEEASDDTIASRALERDRRRWRQALESCGAEVPGEAARAAFTGHTVALALARAQAHEAMKGPAIDAWLDTVPRGRAVREALAADARTSEASGVERAHALASAYAQAIPPAARRALGERYTPAWLARLVAGVVADDAWCEAVCTGEAPAPLVDPTCGAGTLLVEAVQRIAAHGRSTGVAPERALAHAAGAIAGIEIHPIAADIARASLSLALGRPAPGTIETADALGADTDEGLFSEGACAPAPLGGRKAGRIIANPPWGAISGVAGAERRARLERLARRGDIALGGGAAEQGGRWDIAQLFVRRTRQRLLDAPDTAPGAWIVKSAALRAGSWARFRQWHRSLLIQNVDLEALKPFCDGDATRTCVLIEGDASPLAHGEPDLVAEGTAEAFTLRAPHARPAPAPSAWTGPGGFRIGATLYPRSLVLAELSVGADTDTTVTVRTVAARHEPWRSAGQLTGTVPSAWLKPVMRGESVLPFTLKRDETMRLVDPPANESCALTKRAQALYAKHRGARPRTPATLAERIDFGQALSAQRTGRANTSTIRIVHPTSGVRMRAARIAPATLITDSSSAWADAGSEDEAAFVVALLNAPALGAAFMNARTSGRDFSLRPWQQVPIPRYDPRNPAHRALVALCRRAEATAAATTGTGDRARAGQRAQTRQILKALEAEGILNAIDTEAARVLNAYCSGETPCTTPPDAPPPDHCGARRSRSRC